MKTRALLALAFILCVGLTPSRTAQATQTSDTGRVETCGTHLCLNGQPWALKAATIYGSLDDPSTAINLAKQAGANTIRVTNWIPEGVTSRQVLEETQTLERLDRVEYAAEQAGMKTVIDLSAWRNLLQAEGVNPYTSDWLPLLEKVLTQPSGITGVSMRDNPNVVAVSIAGEPDPPKGSASAVSGEGLWRFYRQKTHQAKLFAPSTLILTGGFGQLDWESGLPWKRIFSLPGVSTCAIHLYGPYWVSKDVTRRVGDWCKKNGKPLIVEEFGVPASMPDKDRAAGLKALFKLTQAAAAAGVGVWNIGYGGPGTYDMNPSEAATWQALQDGLAWLPTYPARKP